MKNLLDKKEIEKYLHIIFTLRKIREDITELNNKLDKNSQT